MYYARTFKMNYVIAIYMYMYCIVRSVNIIITRITRVNKICFCHVAISDDISTHADFQELQGLTEILYVYSPVRNDIFLHAKIQVY